MNNYLQDLKAGGRPMTKKEIKIKELQERIDKAIDFIKENANYDISIKQCRDNLFDCECDDLLEILGDKGNE